MSVGRVLSDTFWPGGPGYALTLFVIIIAIGSLFAFVLKWKGEYVKARIAKRLTNLTAVAAALIYLIGWIFFALRRTIG